MTPESREELVLSAVERRRERVNEAIDEELPLAEPETLYEAARSLLVAGGKRLRPAMVLLVAEALSDAGPERGYRSVESLADDEVATAGTGQVDVMAAAVSIEVIHSFTLIHDDIMDDDSMRRGVPAVHRQYDVETAILAGDTLYSKAFEIMLETDAEPARALDAMELLATTCTSICEGQALDIAFEDRTDVLPEEYIDMVERKTAVLYAAAAAVPALVLGADEETADALYNYGLCVGRAFQIQDDVLDLTVPSEQLGKRRGSDLVEGKQTLITLHAREEGVDVDGLVPDDPEAVTDADIEAAVSRLETAGSIDYARQTATDLIAEGKAHLEGLDALADGEALELLGQLADYLIERGH